MNFKSNNIKTSMIGLFFTLFLINCSEQEDNQVSKDYCLDCKSESNIQEVKGLTCKVTKFNETTYILTYDRIDFDQSGYTIGSESILVPCNFPDSLKVPETFITVNGEITNDCCKLLSLPQIRSGFGCKFSLTKIIN